MTLSEIIKAVNDGKIVHYLTSEFTVKTDGCRYFVEYFSEFFGKLHYMNIECGDGWIIWLNGNESDYFTTD